MLDKTSKTVLVTGSANTKAPSPEITKTPTRLLPTNRPIKYFSPARNPNADPTPANDKTPGPGVIISKIAAATNISKINTPEVLNRPDYIGNYISYLYELFLVAHGVLELQD